jgi:hypothetical protein
MPANINLFRRHNYNSTFIETGSYVGDGIKNAIFAGYSKIYSIELADKHYNYCKALFKYNNAVQLHHGDSVDELPEILSNLTQPATFWLDAHYSGGDTTFQGSLTPLMKELEIIKNHPIKTHTLLIDDLREWSRDFPAIGFGLEDIKAKILEINPNYFFSFAEGHTLNDILVADTRRTVPINIVVFSKDRAMQLELFLRSFNNYVKDAERYVIRVLYMASTSEFAQGYEKLCAMPSNNVYFYHESDFKIDVLNLVDVKNPYTVFFVDDDFFKNSFDFFDAQMDIFDWDQRIACRSLRLDRDMRYCYTTQKPMLEPIFYANNVFNWQISQEDFGYPMSLDGHIFRTAEILPILLELDYQNPNTLEGQLVHKRNKLGELMICYDNSIIMNNPINKVQTVNNNLHGNIGAKELNDKFLEGYVIDMAGFGGFKNMSAHQELPLDFIKP